MTEALPDLDAVDLAALHRRRSAKWRAYPVDVLPVWVAEMDLPLAEPVRQALRDLVDADDVGYAAFDGYAEAYDAFSRRTFGQPVDVASAIPVPDVVRGIDVVLRGLTDPGVPVVLTPPVYHPFYGVVQHAGRRVVEVPLLVDPAEPSGYRLDLPGLEAAFAAGARSMLLCHPHNPTGTVHPPQALAAVADLAARYDVLVVSDEIHGPLTLDGPHRPYAALPGTGSAVTLVSASKTFNLAGLKAALLLPGSQVADRLDVDEEVRFGCSLPGVVAAVAAWTHGDAWLAHIRQHLQLQRDRLAELLREHLPGTGYRPPQATYLAWLDLRAYDLGDDPAAVLLEHGRVALSPGPPFGSGGAGHARINLATSGPILAEAVTRMATGAQRAGR